MISVLLLQQKMIITKLLKIDTTGMTGYITHKDQEVDGLRFKVYLRNGNTDYLSITGEEPNIERWVARVGAVTTTLTEINTLGKQLTEVQRTCLNCGQLYTPVWKPIQ